MYTEEKHMPRGMGGMCSPANQQCRYDSSTGWAQKWNAHDTRMHISYAAYPGDDLQWSDRLSGIKICSGEIVEEPVASQCLNWPRLQLPTQHMLLSCTVTASRCRQCMVNVPQSIERWMYSEMYSEALIAFSQGVPLILLHDQRHCTLR